MISVAQVPHADKERRRLRPGDLASAAAVGALAVTLAALIVGLFPMMSPAQTSPSPSERVVGTWMLESIDTRRADTGEPVARETSDQFVGLLIYDASGHMAVQIDRSASIPDRPYTAYLGTYTVDAADGLVVHHVQTSTVASYTGTDLRREYELRDSGDTLVLRNRRLAFGSDSVPVVTELIWRRVN